ncbi:electron transfer flavoprotein subunit beta/FixA family protein [Candidatus Halobonum tyrrellensis]|nr:electron transfer flavoprotein subunit beta [Candidatus Halobonum tyrrellensis]
MKVLVAVKEVAEATDGFEIDGVDIDRRHLAYGLNEWDEYAVETGVRVAEQFDDAADDADAAGADTEVVSVTIGPERAEETVRTVLAKGVDRAIRVWDDDIAAAELDVAAKTRLLAAVAAEEEPDLILTGVQASDDEFGATGVSLADELGVEWAAVVNRVEVDDALARARVHRELEGGVEELSEVDLPAVLTVQVGSTDPRAASPIGDGPDAEPIERRGLADLGLDAGAVESPFRRTGASVPDRGVSTTYFDGDTDERAAGVADLLRDEGVVDG